MKPLCMAVPATPASDLPADVERLLESRLPGAAGAVRWHAQSGTRLDTGRWLSRAPLHAAVCGDRFALIAAGPRPFVFIAPVAVLSRAIYNHVTGALSFPEAAGSEIAPPVMLDPLLARSLMSVAAAPTAPIPSSGTCSHA